MKSDLDAFEDDVVARAKVRGVGANNRASSSGGQVVVSQTSTVVQSGTPKDEWMVGDDFSTRFFFREAAEL